MGKDTHAAARKKTSKKNGKRTSRISSSDRMIYVFFPKSIKAINVSLYHRVNYLIVVSVCYTYDTYVRSYLWIIQNNKKAYDFC